VLDLQGSVYTRFSSNQKKKKKKKKLCKSFLFAMFTPFPPFVGRRSTNCGRETSTAEAFLDPPLNGKDISKLECSLEIQNLETAMQPLKISPF
jgi:hypothetical protein